MSLQRAEQALCITDEAGVADVGLVIGRDRCEPVKAAAQDALDSDVMDRVMGQRSVAGRLKSFRGIGPGQPQDVLGSAQMDQNLVAEQTLNEGQAVRPNVCGLGLTPKSVVGQETCSVRRQVIPDRLSLSGPHGPSMRINMAVLVVNRDGCVRDPKPQTLADQRKWGGVIGIVKLQVAIAVQVGTAPGAKVGCHGRQGAQRRLLQLEQMQGRLPGGAVLADACLIKNPATHLSIKVGQVTELAQGQEVALDVLHPRLDDALIPSQQLSVVKAVLQP